MTSPSITSQNDISRPTGRLTELSHIFYLLSDPTRLKILLAVSERKSFCVSEIAENLGISISNTSHQLRKLELFGLIESSRNGRTICYYPCKNKLVDSVLRSVRLIRNRL